MPAEDPVIVAVGMMTAVGLSTAETATSVRSGVMRFVETPILDRRFQPFTLAEVPEKGLPELVEPLRRPGLTSREVRLLRLATSPLRACTAAAPESGRPLALVMALPEPDTTRPIDPARLLQALAQQLPDTFDPRRMAATLRGRAGGLAAIGHAADLVRAGHVEFIVAGGVDSFRDLYVLGTLDLEGRVKTPEIMDGFVPGEGAGFVLITKRGTAEAANLAPLATVRAWARGIEPGHLYSEEVYRGDGLAATIQLVAAAAGAFLPVQEVYSSMNGESHWAKEWGVSFLRNKPAFAEAHGLHHPADCFGDTGAAAGPLMTGLAAHGFAGGYRKPAALIYGSSDRGERAALLITA